MLFTSLAFFIFLAVVLLVYYLVPKKIQWIILLGASLAFYVSFSWKFLFFIIFTIITIYLAGKWITNLNSTQKAYLEVNKELGRDEKKAYKAKIAKKKKLILAFTLIINIGILVFLKYANFFISNFQSILGWFGVEQSPLVLNLILPLGISFYTFQAIGYLVDVYWGKVEAEQNIFRLGLFLSFFPQIIQGPISRFDQLDSQLKEKHHFDFTKFTQGIQLILWGLFKKLVIADALYPTVEYVFSNAGVNGAQSLIGIIFYMIQDYTDFSGCIDIAMGTAECFGINLPQNFERPYFSRSIPEYWRRWHITLGTWFKDYIFYPLSISKFSMKMGKFCKKFMKNFGKQMPAIFGLILVWLTTGLWHGASWNYVLWGLYYGIIIILGIIFKPLNEKIVSKLKINTNNILFKAFQWLRTMFLLAVGRIIFRAPSLSSAWMIFASLFNFSKYDLFGNSAEQIFVNVRTIYVALVAIVVLLIIDLIKEFKKDTKIRDMIAKKPMPIRYLIFATLIMVIVIFGCYGPGFTSIDFEYMKF